MNDAMLFCKLSLQMTRFLESSKVDECVETELDLKILHTFSTCVKHFFLLLS